MSKFEICPPEKPYYLMEADKGEEYWWCSCGLSENQPFCDGSHEGTGKSPVQYKAPTNKGVFFCGCKKTCNPPHCDGSHKEA